jgi:hypothetical protein
MGFLTRETVRQWLAPIGAVAIVVVAFLENPAFIFMRMMHPAATKASRQVDATDPAVQSANREAELARDLMKVVERRWKREGPPSLADLAGLSAAPAEFDPLVKAYELDAALWPKRGTEPPTDIVLRARDGSNRLLHAGPDAVTVIDMKFVITTGGYR